MAGRLAGKVCVITGTGSMGRAAALTFAREGASVVGCDVAVEPAEETVKLVGEAGGEMVSLQPCHLGDPAECARLVDLAVREFGRIDVLYNLAARSHLHWFEGFTDQEWAAARTDEVDLVFYLTRAAWPQLKASRHVRLPGRHGGRHLAQPPLRPLPDPGSPLRPHHHRGLRDLRG
jgi:NAD(P)-dependent dehydrogenase (short-subunit alcohol dehydrogenase family)